MPIRDELLKLKRLDIWSLMLFVLYNFQNIPEYASISELAYVLDEKNFLKLCEYFGGQTIKIPTVDELELTIYAMLLYQYIDVEHVKETEAIKLLRVDSFKEKAIKSTYLSLKKTLSTYRIAPREKL